MREIKFRAWCINTRTMWSWERITRQHVIELLLLTPEVWTVEQFTGLRDKNGQEIYEGDIVKRGDASGVVYYCDKRGAFVVDGAYGERQYDKALPLHQVLNLRHEILGNIHENPELMGSITEEKGGSAHGK
jgi:uncharacterized phage protein (TIGR01671 family)